MSNLLKEFISLLLVEKAVSIEEAQQNLALFVGRSYPKVYMLYDPQKLLTILKDGGNECDAAYAVLMINKRNNKAWHAAEVEASAALPGFGPLIYDIVMELESGLLPDRTEVSDKAKGIWQYYLTRRNDVEAKLLDDIENPKTKPKIDDAEVYPDEHENPLNYAYFIEGGPDVTALKKRHSIAMKQSRHYRFLAHAFENMAQMFFEDIHGW